MSDDRPAPDQRAEPPEPVEPVAPEPGPDPEPGLDPETGEPDTGAVAPDPQTDEPDPEAGEPVGKPTRPARFTLSRVVVVGLLGLLGFSFVVQVRSVADDPTVAALGEEDLVRILANLDAHEERLREDIRELEETKRRLTTAGESQQEALAEAQRRADELGILAGTLPVEGPGVTVVIRGGPEVVTGATLLDAVQELRGAGAEAMQIEGADGPPVRMVTATHFVDTETGIVVDGVPLRSPYTLVAIGDPQTLTPALHIPGGVVAQVEQDGGTVTVQDEPGGVDVSAVREPEAPQFAQPDS